MIDNSHDDDSDHVLVERLEAARQTSREVDWSDRAAWLAARDNELAAERALAAHRGEPYAVVIDIGIRWDIGAPLPHVVANGSRATVICRIGEPDPDWDGTYVTIVSPSDDTDDLWAIIDLWDCSSIRIGAPNDGAIDGHPLAGRGLCAYEAHEIHNSAWLDEHIRINAVHPYHSDEQWRRQRHFLLAFHDEMVEALATDIEAGVTRSSLRALLSQAADNIIDQPYRTPS